MSMIPPQNWRYVPIMKSKAGEIWTLRHLQAETRSYVTPLLELLPHKSKPIAEHADQVFAKLAQGWDPQHPIFFDAQYAVSSLTGAGLTTAIRRTAHAARMSNVTIIPVTGIRRPEAYQQGIKQVVKDHKTGLIIRLAPQEFTRLQTLNQALTNLQRLIGADHAEIDLLVDYGAHVNSDVLTQLIRLHIGQIPDLAEWRSITVAAGSFPSSLKDMPPGQWQGILRAEWSAWKAVVTEDGDQEIARKPNYSDYGIRDPELPPANGRPSANLRYTHDNYYLVRRGDLVSKGGAQQIPGMCRSLIRRNEYRGPDFSVGDAKIAETAASPDSPGNPQSWTEWGMNHHVELVVHQLLNDRDL